MRGVILPSVMTVLALSQALSWGDLAVSARTPAQAPAQTSAKNKQESTTTSKSTDKKPTPAEAKMLSRLETEAIQYFLDNQLENGLIQDRQTNFDDRNLSYQCSLSATGMGLIAFALASGAPHHMISRKEAIGRVKNALVAARKLPAIHGMMPHFFDPVTLKWKAPDQVSTIDSSWLIAGGLWAAAYLKDAELQKLADELYDRVDWNYWADKDTAGGAPVLSMGMGEKGDRFKSTWDRINSEAAFMYILAIGAKAHPLPAAAWAALKPYNVKVAGEELAGGDLGLFSFQYSNELMNLKAYKGNKIDLYDQAVRAAKVNYDICRAKSTEFKTYKTMWGLSAGDGPPAPGKSEDNYRAYAPETDVDGTAHVMATLSSIDVAPSIVLENVEAAEKVKGLKVHGRYGLSNINLDRDWASKDVVGIDAGVAVMALENYLAKNTVRNVWESLPSSKRAARLLEQK